jgi:hypothetical protein
MVPSTNSITFDSDQHIILARLQAVCPPIAKRPHLQDGFLTGKFPHKAKTRELGNRLVAHIHLQSSGSFWDKDFPAIHQQALMPVGDDLAKRFQVEFGPESGHALIADMERVLASH